MSSSEAGASGSEDTYEQEQPDPCLHGSDGAVGQTNGKHGIAQIVTCSHGKRYTNSEIVNTVHSLPQVLAEFPTLWNFLYRGEGV